MAPLSYGEIQAWLFLSGRFVAPEEIRWLIDMDNAWLATVATEREAKREREREEAERKKESSGTRRSVGRRR